MTTITLNCKSIEWIDIDNRSIEVWYTTMLGEKDFITLDPVICEGNTAEDNLSYLVQDIEENSGEAVCDSDRLYLGKKLMPMLKQWSMIEEN